MQPVPVLVTGVHRRFGTRVALEGVDLAVAAGQIVGLVGPNGSGKTTLLKILAGFLGSDSGGVRVRQHLALAQALLPGPNSSSWTSPPTASIRWPCWTCGRCSRTCGIGTASRSCCRAT